MGNGFYKAKTIQIGGKILSLEYPWVMGVININSESFFKDSASIDQNRIKEIAGRMIGEGVDILDLGAMSTRPGALEISEEVEFSRLQIALDTVRSAYPDIPISIDTYRVQVLKAIEPFSINMINDISGGNEIMYRYAADRGLAYVLMHMKGTPETMQSLAKYEDIVKEILDFFILRIPKLIKAGVKDLIIDPGIGFAKNIDHNFFILNNLQVFNMLELPMLIGLSRKSLIWKTLGISPEEALNGTTALHMVALEKGASILRVHDVKEARQTIKLYHKLQSNKY